MSNNTLTKETENALTEAVFESLQNNETSQSDDDLPFAYFHPEHDGKLEWICDLDGETNKIISVFSMKGQGKQASELPNKEKAMFIRDELIANGWQKIIPPEIKYKYGEREITLNRAQKRKLKKTIKKIAGNDPFKK